jgi:protein involved in polysaccharide export with SLBB domain
LLDAYLEEGRGGERGGLPTDTLPGREVFSAIRLLGIADEAAVDTLRMLRDSLWADRQMEGEPGQRDAVRFDSTYARRRALLFAKTAADSDSVNVAFDKARMDSLSSRIFGLELFERSTSQFEPNLSGPVDANYRLGPGDQLVLILTGDVEAAYSLDVTREGFMVIPQVGQLSVANLTLSELNDLLYARLGRVYSGVRRGPNATTHFTVTVARLRSNQVFVVGDVFQPGSYRVSSAGTALTALYAAGGPSGTGGLRRITVRRGGQVADTLDLYDYLIHGDASDDPRLLTGDVVFVPVHGPRVRIWGEIQRPATYELVPGETLADLIRIAGGFTPEASLHRVQVDRIAPPQTRAAGTEGRDRMTIDVTSDQFARGEVPPFGLEAGDVVRVFAVARRVRQRVVVAGNVWQPGAIGLSEGMMLSDALRRAGGLKSDTYLGQVLISRLNPDSSRSQLRAALRDTTGAVVNDIPLEDDDEIRVFSVTNFRPNRYVVINGAVRRPGRVPYREGMTMRDLVLLADGLEQHAFLQEAEIARLPEERATGRTAVTVRVPLDSSYLFERGPDGRYLGPPGLPAPSGPAPEQPLEPYDHVLILSQPAWELPRTVVLAGEVQFPGRYTLTSHQERVTDLVTRAGGTTLYSYIDGVRFYRSKDNIGRIGINLRRALQDRRDRDNILLEDGDSIFIPRYSPVVNVGGAVNSPVAVAYVPGRSLDYYIRAAGGPARNADNGRAYVTQPNGTVEARSRRFILFSSVPTPRAGSVVTVPARDPNDRKDYTAMVGSVAQVLASLVAIIAIARN